MKKLIFKFENIRKIEVFANASIQSYFEIGTPSATFLFNESGKELKLKEGQELYKDRSGNLYQKLN